MEKNITPINQLSWKDRLKSYKKHPGSFILLLLVGASAVITVTVLVYLVGYILIHGVPYLRPSLFSLTYNSDNVSMMPAIINTITMVLLALLFSVPFGIGAAIYLVEYAKKGNKLVELVRITAETLTGIPSIIYGLFGMLFFVTALHWGYSMLAGAATLAIMVLPVIMRTTEEALLCVPDMYREGSFGLGAGKLRTIFKIVLPTAIPGILSGIILAIGRIVGETAALIYTAYIFVIVHPSFYRFHLYNDSSSVYPKRKRIFFSKDKGTCVVIGVTYGKKRNKIKAGNLLAFF